MTEITVKLDAENGAATIEMRGASVVEPRFRLRDAASERFLTRRGWSKTPSYLPGEAVTAADFTALALDRDLARRIRPGMNLVLEQPTSNIFANLAWPGEAAPAEDLDVEEGEKPAEVKPQAEVATDTSSNDVLSGDGDVPRPAQPAADGGQEPKLSAEPSPVPASDAADARKENDVAGSERAAEPVSVADAGAPVTGGSRGASEAATDKQSVDPISEEPMSLEPAIRDEVIAHGPSLAGETNPAPEKNRSRISGATEEDLEDEDDGWPWGRLVAAAIAFTLLGSLLTYFWQNSAYENELRTAMRAVEAQRDEIKSDLEKRLAEAEARAGAESSAAVTAAEESAASLTQKAASLTKDRDDARNALAEQQARTSTLEERLATAQGEIESLRQAAEANATEQSAVFNDRIEALGKELNGARSELEAVRTQLAERDRRIETSSDELKQAQDEIAALRQSTAENKAALSEEAEERIKTLSQQLDKTVQDLAARDQALRDVQAKLSVANVQIEALKQVAGKATAADLEKSTLADRVAALTEQLDTSREQLAAREAELDKTRTSLDAANAMLSKNAAELDRFKDQAATAPAGRETAATTERLKQERDLYARELATMTESLNALRAERDRLTAAAGETDQGADLASTDPVAASRAIWGATAIDQSGAIYSLQNQITESAASENALALCKGKSNGNCEPLRTYSNSCFSLARIEGEVPRNDNFGFSLDRDWQKAEAGAMRQCEELGANCTVRFTVCSPDSLSKPSASR